MSWADTVGNWRGHGTSVRLLIMSACLALLLSGSASRNPDPFYSRDFVVFSEYDRTIIIKDWEGFGGAQPAGGYVLPQAECSSFFPKLDHFPHSTTVRRQIDGGSSGQTHSQTIDFSGVVLANAAGATEFLFGADGVWSRSFQLVNSVGACRAVWRGAAISPNQTIRAFPRTRQIFQWSSVFHSDTTV